VLPLVVVTVCQALANQVGQPALQLSNACTYLVFAGCVAFLLGSSTFLQGGFVHRLVFGGIGGKCGNLRRCPGCHVSLLLMNDKVQFYEGRFVFATLPDKPFIYQQFR
jgi:hypothetical protein